MKIRHIIYALAILFGPYGAYFHTKCFRGSSGCYSASDWLSYILWSIIFLILAKLFFTAKDRIAAGLLDDNQQNREMAVKKIKRIINLSGWVVCILIILTYIFSLSSQDFGGLVIIWFPFVLLIWSILIMLVNLLSRKYIKKV